MKWIAPALITLLATSSVAFGAESTNAPVPGRYMLGGTNSDGLILIDTATGHTWKYDRSVEAPYREPVWLPLRFRGQTAVAPTELPDAREGLGLEPSPYKPKRPGHRQ